MSDESEQQESGTPGGFLEVDEYGAVLYGGTPLQGDPSRARLAQEQLQADRVGLDAYRAERERIQKSRDLSPHGKERATHEVAARTYAHLDRRMNEVEEWQKRHEARKAEATDLRRLTKIPEMGEGWLSGDDVAYGRHVALEALRRAKMQGEHAVEALLLRAARSGDRVTIGAALYLPPVVREEIIPAGLLPRVAQELHATLEPVVHQELRLLDHYWAHRRMTIQTYREWLRRDSKIHPLTATT